jgi:CshA-type fibril repeat protein
MNKSQIKKILSNDTPSIGATFTTTTVRLCTASQKPNACTVSSTGSVIVKNVGTYKIDSSGVITFTPVKDYVGTPTPLKYQVKDSTGQWANSEYTPTIEPPLPKATPQRLFVSPGDSVKFTNVVGSKALGSGTGLQTGATAGPCFVTVVDSVSSCVTTVTVDGEGTWKINQKTGVATFSALSTLAAGQDASPIRYRITDKWGQTAESILTPYTKRSPSLPLTGSQPGTILLFALVLLSSGWVLRRRAHE